MRFGAIATAFLLAACQSSAGTYELLAPEALAAARQAAVVPVQATSGLPAADEQALADGLAAIGQRLGAELEALGYEVVGVDRYAALRAQLADARGIDLRPGYAAPVELRRLETETLAQLRSEHAVDLVVVARLVPREANLLGTHASWDGRTQDVRFLEVGDNRARAPRWMQGSVGAVSLKVELWDPAGENLYKGLGGLHVMSRVGFTMQDIAVPAAKMLAPEHVERAVALALGGLQPAG